MIRPSRRTQPPDAARSHEAMELERALEILGLVPGARAEEIESAYRALRDELDGRIERVHASALRSHYARLRQQLDPAREAALAGVGRESPGAAERRADAFGTLGLSPGASALDVASAYVTLCEELEREVAAATSEAVRRACLSARAEIDAAYQRCAAQPLRAGEGPPGGDGASGLYETHLAAEPFEVARATPSEAGATPSPEAAAPRALPDGTAPRRPRRGRRLAFALLAVAALAGGISFVGLDRLQFGLARVVARFATAGPPPELVEARSSAEYLRRRIADERRELQARVEENRARVTRLEEDWTSAQDPADYDRMAVEIGRARARAELTEEIAVLAESHVFESADVAVAYGKIELGNELMAGGDAEEATQAFEAAWLGLDQALKRLDLAEDAVGARSEAQAALEAWEGLARSATLEEGDEARAGREVLDKGRKLLEEGAFAEAVPELRDAARHFAVAVADGRKRMAEARAGSVGERAERAPAQATPQPAAAPGPPPVAAPPPDSATERESSHLADRDVEVR